MIHSEAWWLERFRSLFDRALALGEQEWTVDFKNAGADLLEEFREEYGTFGECHAGNHRNVFALLVTEPGTDDCTSRACASCRNERAA